MKRLLTPFIVLIVLTCAFTFITDRVSVGADKAEVVKASQPKATSSKVTRMNASGTVIEVTEAKLKIGRMVKGKASSTETMEFLLEKPVAVHSGEKVFISYIKKDEQLVAIRVRSMTKKAKKEAKSEKTAESKVPIEEKKDKK
jgi:hypothetical protein